ncbi:hypothetical protein NDU88_003889 [Pleurodeles waltl]|uniref:Uncharacterized protein n=1 Tax=Pleurodeles waltl TaxID=8319 RepID=A0AAV7UFL6_PLEWA|nr:hypothetical protein NDU88_003889 [Pleurodeles waltl]
MKWRWPGADGDVSPALHAGPDEPVGGLSWRGTRPGAGGLPGGAEMQKEHQKAMEAVASLSGSDLRAHIKVDEELEQSGSDQDSEALHALDGSGPEVTPGTSDFII